ncbi:MAG: L-fucose:H+ symporter permease [Bacteroidales bacterium]|nr:L-fucose:H+ symporter permease [Bacteroidales bacterium]
MVKIKEQVISKEMLVPFIIITSLFALWGFANDITNPMVAAFQTVMEITNAKASLIQFAFYGGYATMAIPAALFVKRYSYKSGVLLGLVLYATGALLFYPAAQFEMFGFFLGSLYILTFGLAFLETTCNPYIMSMGDEATATRRLNFAQSFNPLGSIMGMFVASKVILDSLQSDVRDEAGNLVFTTLSSAEKALIRTNDLAIIRNPYVLLGFVVLLMFLVIYLTKMPTRKDADHSVHAGESFKRLLANGKYREGVIAQVFYMVAQITCWTFIIQYADNLGIKKSTAQNYNIIAMSMFIGFRFVSTYLMKYFNPRVLLTVFAIGGMCTTAGAILIEGTLGLYCLVATSGFMSLMFPTIYGIALHGLGDDVTLGAAGLIMAIVGGAVGPPIQGMIIDMERVAWLPAVNFSFIIPFICFIAIAFYGYRTLTVYKEA